MKCKTYHSFFKNLSNPLKVNIISILKEKRESSVGELTKELMEEQSKISHALLSLNECKIVNSKKRGKQKIYSLNKNTIVPILNSVDKHLCGSCGSIRSEC